MDYFNKIRHLVGNEPIILSGAAGAIVKEGKILLVRRHNLSRAWGIPGGVQELDASFRQNDLSLVVPHDI